MALPELFANSSTPGSVVALTTLGAAVTDTTGTTLTTSAAAPAALQGAGQFRIVIDSEIMLVTGGAATTTWTVTRGAEGSTAATHSNGASIFHYLTAGALRAMSYGGVTAQGAGTYVALTDDNNVVNTPAANVEIMYCFAVAQPITLAKIGIFTGGNGTVGAVFRLGLRYDTGRRVPGTLIVDAGTVDGTITGLQFVAISQTLQPGLYWFTLTSQGAPTTNPRTQGGPPTAFIQKPSVTQSEPTGWGIWCVYSTGVSGALPTTPANLNYNSTGAGLGSSGGDQPICYLGF